MARIVLDAREFTTTTGRYMNRLIAYLQQLDTAHEFVVLLTPKDAATWQRTAANFSVVPCPYREFSFGEQLDFARQLYGLRADLVHFGMVQQPLLYTKPSVTTMHDLTTLRFRNPNKNPIVFWTKQQIYKVVNVWAAHKNRRIITPTNFVKNDVARYTHVSPEKITVTYEAADAIAEAAEPVAELAGKEFVMYIGRPLPHKNLGRLIEAYTALRATHPKLKLVLAGKRDAVYDMHMQTVSRLGVEDGVVFTGFVSEGQLRWLYENCAVYAFPSLSEGFGLPGLEAMAHGAPVASSNATCLPEVYGDAAHYFDPLDVSDMARAIDELLTDETLRNELVVRGREQVARYSWRRMAEQTLEVYEQALASR